VKRGLQLLTGQPTYVGRDPELESVDLELSRLRTGQGWLMIVEGESGIGKTRLLAEVSARARAGGLSVLSASGYELGQDHPFGAIADALALRISSPDPYRAAMARLLRRTWGERPHLEYRLVDDILSLLERLTIQEPVLLTMDDLQWVDTPSLQSLAHVARSLAQMRLGVICAVRPGPHRPQVDQFLRSVAAEARLLRLGPLPRDAVVTLLTELVGGTPGARLLDHVLGASGNPLLVKELAGALRREGSLREAGGTVELSGQPLPASLHDLVMRWLGSLPGRTSELLRIASVLGTDFSLVDLADLSDCGAGELTTALEPALRSGLLGEAGRRLAFRHQLVRDTVYAQLPRSVRSALHRQAAYLLASRGADAIRVASHLSLGADDGGAEAVDWLRRAAREALSCSPQVAVELLDRAVELSGTGHPAREEMLADRALALSWAGRADEALGAARAMLAASIGAPLEGRLRLGLARALLVQGRWADAARELEIVAARSDGSRMAAARLLGDAALARAHCGELGRAVALAEEAMAIGQQLGDELAQSIALSSLAVVAHFEARHHDSVEASRRAVALAASSGDPEASLRPTAVWLGLGHVDTDRFDDALSVLQVGRRRSEEAGAYWQLPLYDDGIGTLHFHAGRWDDALAEIETCMALARETGTLWWLVPGSCMLAFIAIHRDQDDLADTLLATARRHADSGGFGWNRLLWVSALRQESRGDLTGAVATLEEAWQATAAAGFLPDHVTIGPDLVRLALAMGSRERACEVAERTCRVAERTRVASAIAAGLRCRGLVEGGAEDLLEAVRLLRQSPRPVDLAFTCEDAGSRLAEGGRMAEALPLLDEALREYRRIGARRDLARINRTLRSHGVRRPRSASRRRPERGWESLTATEQRVTELASLGLTNPEIGTRLFISRRTVATHLSHIFAKLGISSRVELAAAAQRSRLA
jgi:DNA-binding CsgD family transcriptional regulator